MWPAATLPTPSPSPAPAGSQEVRFKRKTTFPGNALQVASALTFVSYFFWWPIGCLVWLGLSPWVCNVCSWTLLWSVFFLYSLQLAFYRPHLGKGWPFHWMLYGPLTDFVLCYHDATCVREGPPLDPQGKYLFAMYPHGVYGVCRAFSGGVGLWRTLFPGISARWGSFGGAFYLPGIREFSLFAGCIDASKPVLERAIRRGENLYLLPGGIDESIFTQGMNLTDGQSTDTKLVMVDRKGFVKLAIENGLDVVPGFCFGEKWIHRTVTAPGFVQRLLRPLRLSGTLLRGRGPTFLGFLDPPLSFVWGEPIKVKQQKPVDEKYLDEVHGKVMEAVSGIFARYKKRFAYADDETLTMVSPKDSKVKAFEIKKES